MWVGGDAGAADGPCDCASARACEVIAGGNPPVPGCRTEKDSHYAHVDECFSISIPVTAKASGFSRAIRTRIGEKLGGTRPITGRDLRALLSQTCEIQLSVRFAMDATCERPLWVWYAGPGHERRNTFHLANRTGQLSQVAIVATSSACVNPIAEAITEIVEEELLATPLSELRLDLALKSFQDLSSLCTTSPCMIPLTSLPDLAPRHVKIRMGSNVKFNFGAGNRREPTSHPQVSCGCDCGLTAPACDGACPSGEVCQTDGTGCSCVGPSVSCGDSGPACDGECPDQESCGPDRFGVCVCQPTGG